MELRYKVQNYDWGKLGEDSIVARLVKSGDPSVTIDPNTPYAELWLGTHPNGPSLLLERNVLLSEYIKDNVDAIGPEVRRQFGVEVPFLMKVLSVRKALSIQVHPSKEHAEVLHRQFPEVYKDPNHKPELAIALTPFEALYGIRPHDEIRGFINTIPELSELISKESKERYLQSSGEESEHALKGVLECVMLSDAELVARNLDKLLLRLKTEDESSQSSCLFPLLSRLHGEFPGDVGCWMVYFMTYLTLAPGEALYIAPNVPHAYLSGDCIECMARSDNVVRGGLTGKPRAVPDLLGLVWLCAPRALPAALTPTSRGANTRRWAPPEPDFAVDRVQVRAGSSHNTCLRAGPSLLLVVAGEGIAQDTEPINIRPGTAIFLKASRQLTLTAHDGHTLEVYQASCNL